MNNKNVHNQDQEVLEITISDPALERPIFSQEFLSSFKDTAYQALVDYLEKIGAKQEALGLLEDLSILVDWENELSKGKCREIANSFVMEAVSSASHNIAAIGGEFHSPNGSTYSRES
jgi:hypothetical protein